MKYDAVDWMNVQIQVFVGHFSLVRHEYDAISEAAPLPGKEAGKFNLSDAHSFLTSQKEGGLCNLKILSREPRLFANYHFFQCLLIRCLKDNWF